MTLRCDWANQYDIFIPYHDLEWGVPIYEDEKLFEFLILESMQAGLSWRLILQRRDALNRHFDHFNPAKIARYDEAKFKQLMNTPEIIRNQAKIRATINNAQRFLEIQNSPQGFSELLWEVIGGKPIINTWERQEQIPSKTPTSDQMTKYLKSLGFKFVGSTTCYSFMQAVGMVNDHLVSCFRHQQVQN